MDVGANIGYWSKFLTIIARVDEVHAFEPDPICYRILQKNLLGSAAVVNQGAISEAEGTLELFIDPDHSGDNRPYFIEGRNRIEVPCYSLDSYVKKAQLDRVDFIKIDIQGGEIPALEGARALVENFRPQLMVEVDPTLGRGNLNAYITKFTKNNRYGAFRISDGAQLEIGEDELASYIGNVFLNPR